jgi:hypothetical protein
MSNIWLAGGYNANVTSSNKACICYSTDNGSNWTNSSNAGAIFGDTVLSIAHNGTVWVAGSLRNAIANTFALGYSEDASGYLWKAAKNTIFTTTVYGVAYGNGKFVAVGDNSSNPIAYSTDGMNWTGVAISGVTQGFCVTYSNGYWAVGVNGGKIAYSTDGITWSLTPAQPITVSINSIAYNGTTWVAVGEGANQIMYTTNQPSLWNAAWTGTNTSFGQFGRSVSCDNSGNFIAVGQNSQSIFKSSNGSSWNKVDNTTSFAGSKFGIMYKSGVWVMGQHPNDNNRRSITYSTDGGSNWTNASSPFDSNISSSCRAFAYTIPPPVITSEQTPLPVQSNTLSINAPIQNALNNSVMSGIKAMPLKDSTSDSAASFSNDRRAYAETISMYTKSAPLQKKWQGGSRDSSTVTSKRRVASVGSSLNASGKTFAFVSNTEKNTQIDALARCRGGGATVPPKVRVSPSQTGVPTTNPTPVSILYKTIPRSINHSILANHGPWK